jgi:hypothetical protein
MVGMPQDHGSGDTAIQDRVEAIRGRLGHDLETWLQLGVPDDAHVSVLVLVEHDDNPSPSGPTGKGDPSTMYAFDA